MRLDDITFRRDARSGGEALYTILVDDRDSGTVVRRRAAGLWSLTARLHSGLGGEIVLADAPQRAAWSRLRAELLALLDDDDPDDDDPDDDDPDAADPDAADPEPAPEAAPPEAAPAPPPERCPEEGGRSRSDRTRPGRPRSVGAFLNRHAGADPDRHPGGGLLMSAALTRYGAVFHAALVGAVNAPDREPARANPPAAGRSRNPRRTPAAVRAPASCSPTTGRQSRTPGWAPGNGPDHPSRPPPMNPRRTTSPRPAAGPARPPPRSGAVPRFLRRSEPPARHSPAPSPESPAAAGFEPPRAVSRARFPVAPSPEPPAARGAIQPAAAEPGA